ncbi:hypothetical protein BC936DRAFT_139921 [Jimgerdemannia flammicorona]|uniref:Uncharacterized protein n=1 Tax=Jimgerdemannia flammicorona TaxID=994334 RepID=A0A433B914_9FUNG|nr:hypothetical protein BC936DRAFT_139921 [Jimgerdemannia flammicorona]RUP11959.1 hypothetical protein BC936DRAFT_139921 [Jimgerdemannia flammicorona]
MGLSLPEEETIQQIETNETPNDLAEQDWSKWAKLLRKAQKNARHKHSPENLNIIQFGAGISRSAYMSKDIYDSLQATFPKMDRTYFVDCEAYIFAVLEKSSLEDMQQAVNSTKPPEDKSIACSTSSQTMFSSLARRFHR